MCMCLLPEWNAFTQGVIMAIVGALVLGVGMCMVMVWESLMVPGIIVGVVEGFSKITDKFVDKFLTREGESVEDAKKRLENEQDAAKLQVLKQEK